MAIIRKLSHILSLDLSKMSQQIFDLEESEKRILNYLALKGPMNLSQLAEHTTKYAFSLDRWALKKHLYGSSRFMGLIPYEYVSVTHSNKKENKYELTTKGVLASMAVVPLDLNTTFQKYVKFVTRLPSSDANVFVKKCLSEFMRLLLAWHYLNGINLKKQRSTSFYYLEFFEHMRIIGSIDITISEQEEHQEFLKVVKNCMSYATVIDLITSAGTFLSNSTFSMVDWEKTKRFKEEKLEAGNEYWFGHNLWEWSLHLGQKVEIEKTVKDAITFEDYYYESVVKSVNNNLMQIGINLEWKPSFVI